MVTGGGGMADASSEQCATPEIMRDAELQLLSRSLCRGRTERSVAFLPM